MNPPLFIVALLIVTTSGFAQNAFPGLKGILTEAEWKRSGLDRLTPDEIGVIDAALIRREGSTVKRHETELAAVRESAAAAAPAQKRSLWERFGLSNDGPDWHDVPPLKAKVNGWVSANRFQLDNGQIWEGLEAITYELVDKPIEIAARPNGQFALAVDGQSTTLRVRRVR